MIFTETRLKGAFIIDPERREDERGFFARTFCQEEFGSHGLNMQFVQCSTSYSKKKGTLRGMHYQAAPHEEAKLVRCTRGVIFDVIIDLRPRSQMLSQWVGVELAAEEGRMLYIPEGCAHGFQTLADETEVSYQMSEFFHREYARGVRWDDPAIGVGWPLSNPILSERDGSYPNFSFEGAGSFFSEKP